MNPWFAVALTAAVASALTAAVGLLCVRLVAGRSMAVMAWISPVTAVAAVLVSVGATAKLMFISTHDLAVVFIVCLVAGSVAVAAGLLLAQQIRRLEARSHALADEQMRMEQAEKTRRELVAWVSHDLRTPLSGMRALVEALQDGVAPDPQRYHLQLSEQLDRMTAMVDDLFELSRITSGKLTLAMQTIALTDVITDVMTTVAPLAQKRGVVLVTETASELGNVLATGGAFIEADGRALHRALVNITNNAVRHTPPHGTVTVQAAVANTYTQLSVTDECGGLSPEALTRVFEPGWRGSSARTPEPDQGAGLGLAIVKGIVKAHSGEVSVRNENGGCRFDVLIPSSG